METPTSPRIGSPLSGSPSRVGEEIVETISGIEKGKNPTGICFDSKKSCLFVSYRGNDTIRGLSIPSLEEIYSLKVNKPTGITLDSDGNLAIVDDQSQLFTVKEGKITKLAQFDKGFLLFSSGIVFCPKRNAYFFADCCNNVIKRVELNGVITDFAGNAHREQGHKDGKAEEAYFNNPRGICCDQDSNLYVADTWNSCIRKIDINRNVTTIAGIPGKIGFQDGRAETSLWNWPQGIAFDEKTKSIVVTDTYNYRIRRISRDGEVTTLAGSGKKGSKDSTLTDSEFTHPNGITIDSENGNIYVANTRNHKVRRINLSRSENADKDYSSDEEVDFQKISLMDSKEEMTEKINTLENKLEIANTQINELKGQLEIYQKKILELEHIKDQQLEIHPTLKI